MSHKIKYLIKYVYPEWFGDADRHETVGFNEKYMNHQFEVSGKLLIYIIEHQLIVGSYDIIGKMQEDYQREHPLRLPIKKIYCIEDDGSNGVDINKIRRFVPNFKPNRTMSYHPINETQFINLEILLKESLNGK